MRLRKGDRVMLTSDYYGDEPRNPVWGGGSGHIVGTVLRDAYSTYSDGFDETIDVLWDNGEFNDYDQHTLELYREIKVLLPDELFVI